ncbi:MAG: hypothetical protein QGI83_24475, partial [Candidatus Latescibacteria bacterium]|nr:hypothetical protein [Candidatus Latescibacterota bacterium]
MTRSVTLPIISRLRPLWPRVPITTRSTDGLAHRPGGRAQNGRPEGGGGLAGRLDGARDQAIDIGLVDRMAVDRADMGAAVGVRCGEDHIAGRDAGGRFAGFSYSEDVDPVESDEVEADQKEPLFPHLQGEGADGEVVVDTGADVAAAVAG